MTVTYWFYFFQKQRRELGLKRFWSAVKTSNSSSSQGERDSPHDEAKPGPNCSLPLLQVIKTQFFNAETNFGKRFGQVQTHLEAKLTVKALYSPKEETTTLRSIPSTSILYTTWTRGLNPLR